MAENERKTVRVEQLALSNSLTLVALVLAVAVGVAAQQEKPHPTPMQSVVSLADVHTIYVAPMPKVFRRYFVSELLAQLPHGVTLVQSRGRANAVLKIIDPSNARGVDPALVKVYGGYLSGAVRLLSAEGRILWTTEKREQATQTQSAAGRFTGKSVFPPFNIWTVQGVPRVPVWIADNLADALRAAQKREKPKVKRR